MSPGQCGRVSPSWRRIGSVQFVGEPEPHALYMIVYDRCDRVDTSIEVEGGLAFCRCPSHARSAIVGGAP